MPSTTVRISDTSRKLLGELAGQEGVSMHVILEKALEMYRRRRFLEDVNAAYATVRHDQQAWEALQQERATWDTTLGDGLDAREVWTDEGEARPLDQRTSHP